MLLVWVWQLSTGEPNDRIMMMNYSRAFWDVRQAVNQSPHDTDAIQRSLNVNRGVIWTFTPVMLSCTGKSALETAGLKTSHQFHLPVSDVLVGLLSPVPASVLFECASCFHQFTVWLDSEFMKNTLIRKASESTKFDFVQAVFSFFFWCTASWFLHKFQSKLLFDVRLLHKLMLCWLIRLKCTASCVTC